MIVLTKKTPTARPTVVSVKQSFRSKAEVWYGPLWLSRLVARQAIVDGACEATVTEGAGQSSSRVLAVDIPETAVVTFRAKTTWTGRRLVIEVK